MRPAFAYYGGKVGMARRIVSMFPEHRVYIEPFAGSLAVLFAKKPAMHEIVNDLDNAIVTFFRVLREQPAELERVCRLSPVARAEFDAADLDVEGLDDMELARRFFVRVNQSFASTAGRQTGWSITTARTQSVPGSMHGRIDRFELCARRLATVAIERCNAAELIDRLATTDSLIYCDPPYLASTRMGRFEGTKDYRCDMGHEAGHRELASALHCNPATVILSGYPSSLYDELYGDWPAIDIEVTAHSSNAVGGGTRTSRVERIWSNRPITEHVALSLFDLEEAPA